MIDGCILELDCDTLLDILFANPDRADCLNPPFLLKEAFRTLAFRDYSACYFDLALSSSI